MEKCQTCSADLVPGSTYLATNLDGMRYPVTPGSFAAHNCKECVKAEAKKWYTQYRLEVPHGNNRVCARCRVTKNLSGFATADLTNFKIGFPAFCRICQSECRKKVRKAMPVEKLEADRKIKREASAKKREEMRQQISRKCEGCMEYKPRSMYRKTCDLPRKHEWAKNCKDCEDNA